MNCRMSMDKASSKEKVGVLFETYQWCRFIGVVTSFYLAWYNLLEHLSRILEHYNIRYGKINDEEPDAAFNSIGEPTSLTRCNSLLRQDSRDILLKWLDKEVRVESNTIRFESYSQMMAFIMRGCARNAYIKFLANLVLQSPDLVPSLTKLSKTFIEMQRHTAKTVKFRFLFKSFKKFLRDVGTGKVENLSQMIRLIADNISTRRPIWWMEFEYGFIRCDSSPQNVYESALAIIGIFHRYGVDFDSHDMVNLRKCPRRLHDAMLTLFMVCAVQKCTLEMKNELNITAFGGTDRVLLSNWKDDFKMTPSPKVKASEETMKDLFMWNAMLNECSEYVDGSWSINLLSRVMWALQWGRQFVERCDYDRLMTEVNQDDINTDLTDFKARVLLAFVITGVVRCRGDGNDAFFRMIEATEATCVLRGRLPSLCIQDLIDLRVLQCVGKNQYVTDFPYSCPKFNTEIVDEQVSFSENSYNKSFYALPTQTVL